MIESLHVKNMALIDEAEVEFGPGLNILTGETGAGKSILLGSLNIALGAGSFRDYVREDTQQALVELTFRSSSPSVIKKLEEMDISQEEDEVIISRKYRAGRTVSKVNGESVPIGYVKELAGELLDIHGQHEHQKLLYPKNHLGILDEYAGNALHELLHECREQYRVLTDLEKELQEADLGEEDRAKEADFLRFELGEIEAARLAPGEDEELELAYRRMSNGQRIMESVQETGSLTGCGGDGGAAEAVGHAVRALGSAVQYDESLEGLYGSLSEVESLLNDFNRALADYQEDFSFDAAEMERISTRLDELNRLKAKYGRTIDAVLSYQEDRQKRLDLLEHYEDYLKELQQKTAREKKKMLSLSEKITAIRKQSAAVLEKEITRALTDLNFLDVRFEISFEPLEEPTDHGMDRVTFLISTNPGMPLRPLGDVASGGELSRIMLAIKAVMADRDAVETLVFDEIDTGISGRTAQKVSEKMNVIAASRQIICITHLAQIAAMAREHFLIEKRVEKGRTVTAIRPLDEEESVQELARILGGVEITKAVLDSAREMKELAKKSFK